MHVIGNDVLKGKDSLWRPENLTEVFLAKLGHRRQVEWDSTYQRISRETQFENWAKQRKWEKFKKKTLLSFAIHVYYYCNLYSVLLSYY